MPQLLQWLRRTITIPEVPQGRTKVHLAAQNRSWSLVDECTLEVITSRINKQVEMLSASSTRRMISVPPSAPTSRIISATARTLERWWEDQASLIFAAQVQIWLPKQVRTWPKMSCERTIKFTNWHRERQSLNAILIQSLDNYQMMITGLRSMEGARS